MALQRYLLLSLFLLALNVFVVFAKLDVSKPLNRSSFPSDFIFGSASASFQVEGAWNISGKGPSIWDNFTQKVPSIIVDGSNGNVAVDFYHRYKEDLALAKSQGWNSFRFSIAWTRILPKGNLRNGKINHAGIDFYNKLINEIRAQGMKPLVTIFHWDTPQALEDEYLGFLSPKIVADYRDYAEICFKYFGDRVKHWVTINEAYSYAVNGYDYGIFAPGRCSNRFICPVGDPSTEPYKVAHHLLLAHAAAVKVYREKYKAKQKGMLGMALYSQWYVPYNSSKREDIEGAKRAMDFQWGWYLHPMVYGDYPEDMKKLVGTRLPKFTTQEKKMLLGSYDFVGLNYYTANYAIYNDVPRTELSAHTDALINSTQIKDGVPIGIPTGFESNYVVPWGFLNLLRYVKDHYNNPIIYVTETGMPDVNIKSVEQGVKDSLRVYFYDSHIKKMHQAMKQYNVKVKGFFAWSFHDNFEWFQGYTQRFGVNFIDYDDNLKRYEKDSALWFRKFLQ